MKILFIDALCTVNARGDRFVYRRSINSGIVFHREKLGEAGAA